ncbi:MAG: alpha/beta hydrolase fold domain-containing protein [Polyangiales bacterium]
MNPIRLLMDRLRPLIRLRRKVFGPHRPTWSEEFETIATVLRTSADFSVLLPLRFQRYALDPPRPDTAVVKETTISDADAGGVPGKWFTRPDSRHDHVVIYLHGGGYSTGSVRSHRDLIARICKSTRSRVLALDYRLAPEHPFPAQLEDSMAAYRWLLAQGISPSKIAFAGESAGGGLCVSTMLKLRETGEPMPCTAVLISPWLDLEAQSPSFHENRRWDFVTRKAMAAYARRFVREHEVRHPLAAPIHADVHDLPPILIQVGEVETLRDEGIALAERIREQGGDVTLEVWDDMIHAFHVFAPLLPVAQDAIDRLSAHIVRCYEDEAAA